MEYFGLYFGGSRWHPTVLKTPQQRDYYTMMHTKQSDHAETANEKGRDEIHEAWSIPRCQACLPNASPSGDDIDSLRAEFFRVVLLEQQHEEDLSN